MNLTPLTLDRIRHMDVGDQAPNTGSDSSEYRRWACTDCNRLHHEESSAERCCPRRAEECFVHPQTRERFYSFGELASAMAGNRNAPVACPVCGNDARDFHDAANCCLWKDLSVTERMHVASEVEHGQSWAEALGVVSCN